MGSQQIDGNGKSFLNSPRVLSTTICNSNQQSSLEKLDADQLVKKFKLFSEARSFISISIRSRQYPTLRQTYLHTFSHDAPLKAECYTSLQNSD